MIKKPAHKDTVTPPGQIVNKWPAKTMGQIVNDVTLADYYERKMKEKLTVDMWINSIRNDIESIDFVYHGLVYDLLEKAWNTSRENM